MENKKRTAILILTHLENRTINNLFSEINKHCSYHYDIFFICDNSRNQFGKYASKKNYFLFDTSQMTNLGYPGKSEKEILDGSSQADNYHKLFHFSPGNVELPIILFSKAHPDYAYYWIIEYDVRFTGDWNVFFSTFDASDADLLGTTLTRREAIPTWFHWPSLDVSCKNIGPEEHLRGFFPVYRLSRRAVLQLDSDYLDGVKGHFECLIPTLLHHAGLKIEDIGGDGEFVRPGNRNRFYRNTPERERLDPGTFVYRPVMHRTGKEQNMLWHPVKRMSPWKAGMNRMRRLLHSATARYERMRQSQRPDRDLH